MLTTYILRVKLDVCLEQFENRSFLEEETSTGQLGPYTTSYGVSYTKKSKISQSLKPTNTVEIIISLSEKRKLRGTLLYAFTSDFTFRLCLEHILKITPLKYIRFVVDTIIANRLRNIRILYKVPTLTY